MSQLDEETAKELHSALRSSSYARVSTLLSNGLAPATRLSASYADDYPGRPGEYIERTDLTLLHYAGSWKLKKSQAKLIRRLLDGGADIHATDTRGYTALHDAAADLRGSMFDVMKRGYESSAEQACEPVQLMLDAGADVNARTDLGFTPLHLAALYSPTAVALLLMEHGADIHAKAAEGETALHFAAMAGNTELVTHLLQADADVHAQEADGMTPLSRTAYYTDSPETLRQLVQAGAELCPHISPLGNTPLHYAAMSGNMGNLKMLLESGLDINLRNTAGHTALLWALAKRQFEIVRYLLENGADPTRHEDDGETFTHLALDGGDAPTIELAQKHCPAFKRIIKQLQQKQRKKKFVQLLIGIAILLLIRAVVTLIQG